MEPELSARPLTAAPADQALYVRRDADEAVDRAVGLNFNTMLASARGMGATSLLYRLEGAYPERTTYLASAAGGGAPELLDALGDRLEAGAPGGPGGRDPLDALERRLRDRGADPATPWIVLLDGPVGADAAHELFGTARDALFALPLRWVVAAPADRLGQYLTPPADVFFEHVAHLDPLTEDQERAVLERRRIELRPERLAEVVELADGTPRHLLALARQALVHPDRSLIPVERPRAAEAGLSRSAATLWAELQGRGPTTAVDPELQQRLGWGEARMRRAMQELVDADLVWASQGRADGPGRPPVLYQPAPSPGRPGWE